jgi:serine/threonine protein kinase
MLRKGDQIGPYTLLDKLGRGGFGVVWLAEKRAALVVTKVALKMPNDDEIDLDAVRREAALWVQASGHPNVLPIIDADIYDDQVVIVSEYAPDGSLGTWLKKNGGKAPTITDAIEMASGILSGLDHLHARKIIHRDLKPANILLQGRTPRLVDFGLARVMRSASHSRTVSGTYSYMPPETFEGNRSEQTDVYSVGVILYEMLTGRLPYPQATDAALIGAILHGKADSLPDNLSIPIRSVVERAMEKDLDKRFRSAAEMLKALQDASLTAHSSESYAPITEVMPSYLSVELLSATLPPPPSAEASQPSTPIQPNIETPSYETRALNLPVTDPSISSISQDVDQVQSQQPIVSRIIAPQPQNWQQPKPDKITSPSRVVESKEDIPAIAPTVVSKEKQYGYSRESKRSVEVENRNNTFIVVGAVALAVFFGLGILGLGIFAFVKLSGSSVDNKNENQTTLETQDDKTKKREISGRLIETSKAETIIKEVAVSKDGKLIAAAGKDGNVPLWKNGDYQLPAFKLRGGNTVLSVTISLDGKIIAASGNDKKIRLWNTSNGNLLYELKGHAKEAFSISFSEDGQTLVSASYDNTIRFWDVIDGEEKRKIPFPDNSWAMINISLDFRLVAYLDSKNRVHIWNLDENRLVSELKGDKFNDATCGAFSLDGKFAIGNTDGKIRLYSVSSGEQIIVLSSVNQAADSVIFNSNGEMVAAGFSNGQICLWNANNGQLLGTLTGHNKSVTALAFSADRRILVSGSEDEKVCLWEINSP